MSQNSAIEWTDATWTIVQGCDLVSPGCTHCYVPRVLWRLMHNPNPAISSALQGTVRKTDKNDIVFTGKVVCREDRLTWPLEWKKPQKIFVPSHGDIFHEDVPDSFIDRIFAVMAMCPQHTFQVLTKRPERMRDYMLTSGVVARISMRMCDLDESNEGTPLLTGIIPNVWLGVSVEDQARADERIPHLLATPAAVRFLSCEPLLGAVDLTWVAEPDDQKDGVIDALLGCNWIDGMGHGEPYFPSRPGHLGRRMTRQVVSTEAEILTHRKIDWVIAGGESGPGKRPINLEWMRSLRDQCHDAGIPFFGKQWDKVQALPSDLMVREFPHV